MWEISNYFQWLSFGRAIVFGVGICIFYDILRFIRFVFCSSKLSTFISDLFFWIVTAFSVFCFFLATTNGQMRLYALAGISLGFLLFRVALSRLIFLTARPIRRFVSKMNIKYKRLIKKAQNFSFKGYIIKNREKGGFFLSKKRKIS